MTTTMSPCAQRTDIDICASSVSSAELSPPPRPDSPRLFLADSSAVLRARLLQLQVWGDAAEDERDEEGAPLPQPPVQRPPDRMADRTRPSMYNLGCDARPGLSRRKSLFCGRPASDQREMTRKPSLWGPPPLGDRNSATLPAGVCGNNMRKPSFRRRSSFHRYARISGDETASVRKERNFSECEFDDLVDGLNATKVTERPVEASQ